LPLRPLRERIPHFVVLCMTTYSYRFMRWCLPERLRWMRLCMVVTRKGKRGWGAAGKHIVFGLYQRNGQVITFPVPDRKTNTLIPLVFQHTKPGSLYYSDDWHAYTWLSIKGDHAVVKKVRGAPKAKGRNHLNGIEGFWSFSKNWLYQYRGIPRHHFHLYLKETEFRFNNRDEDLFLLLSQLLTNNLVPKSS
jgi:transposase